MTPQDGNDILSRLRRVLGDDVAFPILAVAQGVARRWRDPTDRGNLLERLIEIGTAIREAGLEGAMRDAAGKWSQRNQKPTDVLGDLIALVGGERPLLGVIDAQLVALGDLRRRLAQPAPRQPAEATPASRG